MECVVVPILHNPLGSMHQTAADYEGQTAKLLKTTDISSIAPVGHGDRWTHCGHLPGTESVQAAGLVTSYQTEQFDRITLTQRLGPGARLWQVFELTDKVKAATGGAAKPGPEPK